MPLDEICDWLCRRLDGSPAHVLALDSILTHRADNRGTPWKRRAVRAARGSARAPAALLTRHWSGPHGDPQQPTPKGWSSMSDRTPADRFLDAAIDLLHRVRDEEADSVAAAGALLADTVADGGRLFAFGAGHSSLAAQDVVYRAGGLALMLSLIHI